MAFLRNEEKKVISFDQGCTISHCVRHPERQIKSEMSCCSFFCCLIQEENLHRSHFPRLIYKRSLFEIIQFAPI